MIYNVHAVKTNTQKGNVERGRNEEREQNEKTKSNSYAGEEKIPGYFGNKLSADTRRVFPTLGNLTKICLQRLWFIVLSSAVKVRGVRAR